MRRCRQRPPRIRRAVGTLPRRTAACSPCAPTPGRRKTRGWRCGRGASTARHRRSAPDPLGARSPGGMCSRRSAQARRRESAARRWRSCGRTSRRSHGLTGAAACRIPPAMKKAAAPRIASSRRSTTPKRARASCRTSPHDRRHPRGRGHPRGSPAEGERAYPAPAMECSRRTKVRPRARRARRYGRCARAPFSFNRAARIAAQCDTTTDMSSPATATDPQRRAYHCPLHRSKAAQDAQPLRRRAERHCSQPGTASDVRGAHLRSRRPAPNDAARPER